MQRLDAPHRGELSFSICGTAAALLARLPHCRQSGSVATRQRAIRRVRGTAGSDKGCTRRAALSPVAQPPGYRHARRFRGCPGGRPMWSERRISLTIEWSGANGSNLLPGPTQEDRRADYWRTLRGAEQRRACKGRAAGADWRRLIRAEQRGTSCGCAN